MRTLVVSVGLASAANPRRPASHAMNEDPARCETPLRVLICEDEGLTTLRLRKTLLTLGHQIAGEATNGEEAVALAGTLTPDVILMDVNMPVLDGVRATERIMEACPAPILMLTAHSGQAMVERAIAAGASGYLVKPVRNDQLRTALLMARSQFVASRGYLRRASALTAANAELRSDGERDRLLLREAERQAREARVRAQELGRQLKLERETTRVLAEGFVTSPPELPGVDIGVCYEPASEVSWTGGDIIDFIPFGEHRLGLMIGDLCGHGLEAIAHVARTRYMLHAYAAEDPAPASVVHRLNRTLCGCMTDDCPFLTIFYGVLDLQTWSLTYCSAGHPPPFIYDPATGVCSLLTSTGGMVGGVLEMDYRESTVGLAPGAILTLFTDGVVEARARGRMLEQAGVCAVVAEQASRGAVEIAASILARAVAFAEGRLVDDAAITVVKRLRSDTPSG
jgi:serine phosphatase RsbU (regulator of sigma subunit)